MAHRHPVEASGARESRMMLDLSWTIKFLIIRDTHPASG
jgi:hypothetical protein